MSHLDCSICNSILDKVCTLSCGYCFCLSCITQWLKDNQKCPNCHQKVSFNDEHCYVVSEAVDTVARNPAASSENLSADLSFYTTREVFELNNSLANDLQIETHTDELTFHRYQEAAERGDAEAMVNLGNCCLDGIGVNKDERQAVYWFLKAFSKGNSSARTHLGKTIHWCQKHAELGDEFAMKALGDCYCDGEGIEQDYSKAVYWYHKAAELGHSVAMNNLGFCYEHGQGIQIDKSKAMLWYQKAADLCHSRAMYNLGVCYKYGHGIEKDNSKAVYWYQKAADLGDSLAMYNLGVCYKDGQGIPQDDSIAVYWYQKAADLGDSDAEMHLQYYFSIYNSDYDSN
ncbi:hypothetical protein GEMRC1_006172 [Eukaryota sp. GEM-RC1]